MAEGVLFDLALTVIDILGVLAREEIEVIGQLGRIKDEIEKFSNTVSSVEALCLDAEEQQELSHEMRDWLGRMKDAVYEADDLLDDYLSTEALAMTRRKIATKVLNFFTKSNPLAYYVEMFRKIRGIKRRMYLIAAERMHPRFESTVVERSVRNWARETSCFVAAEDVIGRENDKNVIKGRLLDSNIEENVSVLPIVGIGGIGKTILAKLIFNDEEIIRHFEKKLWVCVNDTDAFDVKGIVEKILESPENLEMNTLINNLQNEINGKRYLLVLDDLWNDDREKWLTLKRILRSGARGSRILVTTRSRIVAQITQTVKPHFLKGLDEKESWSLFEKTAFEEGQELKNKNFVRIIGDEILKRCSGIPLAIRTIGSLLFEKSEAEWLAFRGSKISEVLEKEGEILSTLKLSYDHLPRHLKQCFAYCGLFPKEYMFDKQTLIQLWMAQGFISLQGQNQCLEDVGHDYIIELFGRSFFQEVEEENWGNMSFKMHNLMHDLAMLVAQPGSTTFGTNGENIFETTYHVSFDFHLVLSLQILTPLFKATKLRTLLWLNQTCPGVLDQCNAIISGLKLLRVLDLHETGIEAVPSSITRLIHLRYLDLSDNRHIQMLPPSLSSLRNLQTLKLSGCVQLKELPRDIEKFVNLRFLEIDGCRGITHMPHGLGQLINLQWLSQFVMSKDTGLVSNELEILNRLNLRGMLKLVHIRHGNDVALKSEVANLKDKQHLQALKLEWIEDDVDDADVHYDEKSLEGFLPHPNVKALRLDGYMGVKFPSKILLLKNLRHLVLYGCKKCKNLRPLDQFPSLKALDLKWLYALEYISEISSGNNFSNSSFLPSLEELKLNYCPNLKGWWKKDPIEEVNNDDDNYVGITTGMPSASENHLPPLFPLLSKLSIRGCPQLTSMPLFPYLEKLELYNCSFKPLEQTAKIATATAAASTSSSSGSSSKLVNSSFTPLSKLMSLEIGGMEEPLPEGCLRNLISLNRLWIYECRDPLLHGMQHLTELKQLGICSSEVFDLSNNGNVMEWQVLRSLSSLWLFQLPKLVSLPMGLQKVTSMRKLTIDSCPSLMEIPNWICKLTSLEILEILQCPKLTSLPIEIGRITTLLTLKIFHCPILLRRCNRESGSDWHKISHIPYLYLEEGN